jgi:hypothetical protein
MHHGWLYIFEGWMDLFDFTFSHDQTISETLAAILVPRW